MGAAVLGSPRAHADAGPATAPAPQTSPSEQARLARGREIRSVLLTLLDQVDADGGTWPDKPPQTDEGRGSLVYSKPEQFGEPGLLYQQQVVVHELAEKHPDGVWVGYADGHVEFAPTPSDLAACKDQLRMIRDVASKYHNTWGPNPETSVDPKTVAPKLAGELTLRILDPEGRPVPRALVGAKTHRGDGYSPPDERVMFWTEPKALPAVTDSDGEVVLPASLLFNPTGSGSGYLDLGTAPLVVLDERRDLIALEELPLSDFGGGKARTVRLRPACHITADLTSFGLAEVGKGLDHTEAYAAKPGMGLVRALFSFSSHGQVDLLVPPGDYGVYVAEHHCYPVTRFVHVGPSDHHLTLHLDLPPRRQPAELAGHPAPELRGIKVWKNGGPVTLAELHGKVVLLDFWGCWCGVCNVSMPELMKLYDRYKDKGLVIVAIHDDSVESIAEMDRKLQSVRKDLWGGRDLPFLIALDGGGDKRIPGTGQFTRGATNAAYHVWLYPTTYLIGRDGTVLRSLRIDPDKPAEIEKTIDELVNARSGEGK
ncbi:MAG TPA: TlpA disulfide reductase family protein [Tepidisphaeraceae bacterium]